MDRMKDDDLIFKIKNIMTDRVNIGRVTYYVTCNDTSIDTLQLNITSPTLMTSKELRQEFIKIYHNEKDSRRKVDDLKIGDTF